MKFLATQLSYFFAERQMRQNLKPLFKFLLFLISIITFYSVLFHVIMEHAEGKYHSWLTGFYWTLTVMSTLGFGDITFTSDIGRFFSIVVLVSGILLLMIMLPFAFIRYFYAPWLEAQIRLQAPRELPAEVERHVVICKYDSIAPGLIRKLKANHIPYCIVEPDPVVAARMLGDDVSVVAGEVDSRTTYHGVNVERARLVLANIEDTVNTNITLTVREVDPDVPVVALVEHEDSIDILELSGATHVLPLKQKLGEFLANRVDAGDGRANVVGSLRNLIIAELPIKGTPFSGSTIRDAGLREKTGASIAAIWEHGKLAPVRPDTVLEDSSIAVVVGDHEQVARLNDLVPSRERDERPVLVIGGGKVGCAAARTLKQKGFSVHLVERNETLYGTFEEPVDQVVIGDAADRDVLERAGLADASSVILTTNDDAVNIYLAVYCRRLNPNLRIVSRITHDRNLEAIHRAGADFVLSYATLGVESIFAQMLGRDPIILGGGVDYFFLALPSELEGMSLAESQIGSRTGLVVIAVKNGDEAVANPPPTLALPRGSRLLVLGTPEQRRAFAEAFD